MLRQLMVQNMIDKFSTDSDKHIKHKLGAYIELMRFDRPVGIELLLWPTLWAVFLAAYAAGGLPSIKLVVIFTLGAVLMRAAGCVINDFADRKIDGKIARTKNRPLADGRISSKQALMLFAVLVLMSASLLLWLPLKVSFWAVGALILASSYPFMKRITYGPQLVLGAAFSWAIPMAYVAVLGHTTPATWLLYVANLCWTVAYDTQYAMTDRADDLKAGVKSTAIWFGRFDVLIITLLHGVFLLLLLFALWPSFGALSLLALPLPILLIARQYKLYRSREPAACFTSFLQNAHVGRAVMLAVLLLCWWV